MRVGKHPGEDLTESLQLHSAADKEFNGIVSNSSLFSGWFKLRCFIVIGQKQALANCSLLSIKTLIVNFNGNVEVSFSTYS